MNICIDIVKLVNRIQKVVIEVFTESIVIFSCHILYVKVFVQSFPYDVVQTNLTLESCNIQKKPCLAKIEANLSSPHDLILCFKRLARYIYLLQV